MFLEVLEVEPEPKPGVQPWQHRGTFQKMQMEYSLSDFDVYTPDREPELWGKSPRDEPQLDPSHLA